MIPEAGASALLDLIVVTLQVMAFLDNGLTFMVVVAAVGTVMVGAGLSVIARSRIKAAAKPAAAVDEPIVLRGAE